jgi:tetratricopeptide (TPR) repeat protein
MVRIKLATVAFLLFLGISNNFGQDLEKARYFALSDRFDEAKEMLNKIIQSEPNNASAYFYLGQTIIREYLTDSLSNSLTDVCNDAKQAFETGLQKDSAFHLNLVGKGMLEQLCKNDTTAANAYFAKALTGFPKNKKKWTEVHGLIYSKIAFAQTLGKINRPSKTIDYNLSKAKEIAPTSFEIAMQAGEIYLDRKDGTNAIANFNKAAGIKGDSPLPLIKIGDLYLAAKNYDVARNNYDQAKDIDSTNAIVYKSYGELWNTANRYDLAKVNFRKYLQYSGNNISAKISYIISLFKTRDYDEAIEVIKEVQSVDNSRNFLNRVAGYSYFDKKSPAFDETVKYMEKFLQNAKPTSITGRDYSYYGRALIRLKTDSATTAKGIQMLEKSNEMTPDDRLVAEMASAYYSINDYEGAIRLYTQKINSGSTTPNDLIHLGRAYMQIKDFVKAGETFDKAIAADPNNMDALTKSAVAYAYQDPDSKMGLAKPKYEQVIQLGNTDPKKYSRELFDAYKFMGSYYLYGENKSNAGQSEEYYKKIITLDPGNKEWLKTAYSGLAALYTNIALPSKSIEKWELAKRMYEELRKVDPGNTTAPSAIINIQKQINVLKLGL